MSFNLIKITCLYRSSVLVCCSVGAMTFKNQGESERCDLHQTECPSKHNIDRSHSAWRVKR